MGTSDFDAETYETIPWAQLAPPAPPLITRVGYWVVGALVAAVATYVLVTLIRDEPRQTVVDVDPASAIVSTVGATAVPTTVSAPPVSEPQAAMLYAEADLMAVAPEEDERVAAMRAVWFVTDYFTLDGDPQTGADVLSALPAVGDVALPHDLDGGVSYVEWAEPFAVRPDGPGRYIVDVAFRALQGSGDSGLARQPVRAVRVPVAIMPDGSPAILDLPEPVPLPSAVAEVAPAPLVDPPPDVVAGVAVEAALFGTQGDILGASVDSTGWRIVVAVRDASGLSWPLVVRP